MKDRVMQKELEVRDIEQLLAEADNLIQQIDTNIIKDIQEGHRVQFEKCAQDLKKIKLEVQGKIDNKRISGINSGADGMHEAFQDIVKAMQDLKQYLTRFR